MGAYRRTLPVVDTLALDRDVNAIILLRSYG